MDTMRALCVVPVLFALSCAGAGDAVAPVSADDAAAGRFLGETVLELPRPPQSTASYALIERSSILPGTFAFVYSGSQHMGCSQSWSTTSTNANVTIGITGRRAVVSLRTSTTSASGSRMHPGSSRDTSGTVATLEGSFEETAHGKLKTTLKTTSCDGSFCCPADAPNCSTASVEVSCELHEIPVDSREVNATPGSGGTVQGLTCTGLGSLLPDIGEKPIPFGPGLGVEVVTDGSRWGSSSARTYKVQPRG